MNISPDLVGRIPEIYRDFMLVLESIPDTRQSILRINGLQLGEIFTYLRSRHHYEPSQVRAIADNLKKAGLVEEDVIGFFKPTGRGEALIEAIANTREPASEPVPDFPDLPEL